MIHRTSELVRGVITFSHKSGAERTVFDLDQLVTDTTRLLAKTLPKNVDIKHTPSATPLQVFGDIGQLQQVLLNLAANSRDAMAEGGTLRIAARQDLDHSAAAASPTVNEPAGYAVLEVTDSGCGMEPDQARQIFDPFFTTKEIGKGTGLGLSIAYGIIDSHNGQITCSSAPGEGTSFTIRLPLADGRIIEEPDRPPAQTASQHSVHEETAEAAAGGGTILLIDDEPAIRKLSARILKAAGFALFTAADGLEGLNIFEKHAGEIDLVVLDLGLPRMDGTRCLQALKKIVPTVPAVVASGYLDHPVMRNPEEYGVAYCLKKPYQINALAGIIQEVLER